MEHDKLFADLDALNEQHIEVGLAAGVWKVQVRALVQHYLYDLKLKRVEAAADRLTEMEKAMRLAVGEAIKAKTRASAALIIGAMVAAMAGALIAFLALRKYGCQPRWSPGQHSSTTPIWAAIARALPRDSYAMRLTSVTHGKIAIGRQGLTNITEFLAIGVLSQGSLRERVL